MSTTETRGSGKKRENGERLGIRKERKLSLGFRINALQVWIYTNFHFDHPVP